MKTLSKPTAFSQKYLVLYLVLFTIVGGAIFLNGKAVSATYYVSPTGSDTNNGTSQSTPWRTISKVKNTCFQPGDIVAFEGGKTFSDTYLGSACPGSSTAPITFTSYGTGRAILTGGVYIDGGRHHLTFDNLELTNANGGIFSSCGSCSTNPTYNITVKNSYIHNTPNVGLQTSTNDSDWLISGNRFEHIGDSGIITYYSSNVTIDNNVFTDTGYNTAISYGKHSIYSKSRDVVISNNEFSNNTPNGQAVSIRTANQRIFGNKIHDTPAAFGFFDYDTTASPQGTSYIYNNKIWNTTSYGFYYAGQADPNGKPPSVSFVIANNTFVASSGEMFNLSEVPSTASVKTANNIFSGTFGSAYRGCGTCTENNNLWFGGTTNIPSGAGDLKLNPSISTAPNFVPTSTSPVINAGTTNVSGLTYSSTCNGQPLSYCGTAPDMGAVEYGSGSVTPPPPPPPPATTISQSITNGSTLSGIISWIATTSNDSSVDSVTFYVDNVLRNTETSAPWTSGDPPDNNTGNLDSNQFSNGSHTFKAVASLKDGTSVTTQSTATVSNNTTKTGDANGDGKVDVLDLSILLSKYGTNYTPADFNKDGLVDITDISILLTNYGS